jgi:hypothetical protein
MTPVFSLAARPDNQRLHPPKKGYAELPPRWVCVQGLDPNRGLALG